MKSISYLISSLLVITFCFISCKDKKDNFYNFKKSPDIILWNKNLNIVEKDFLSAKKSDKTIYGVEIATRTTKNTNNFKYYVFFNKRNSFLNKNQSKQNIENDILIANLSMNIFEIEARKFKKKFQQEKIIVKKRLHAQYLISDFGKNVDQTIDKYKKVLEENNYDKKTIAKMKESIKIQLNSL